MLLDFVNLKQELRRNVPGHQFQVLTCVPPEYDNIDHLILYTQQVYNHNH